MGKLPEDEKNEVKEQLERLRSEWQVLNNQVEEGVLESQDDSTNNSVSTNEELASETFQKYDAQLKEDDKLREMLNLNISTDHSASPELEAEANGDLLNYLDEPEMRNLAANGEGSESTNAINPTIPNVDVDENLNNERSEKQQSNEEPSCTFELFMRKIKDIEDFLDLAQGEVSPAEKLLTELSNREEVFEGVMEMGLCLVRETGEEEQFEVQEKMVDVENRWCTLKQELSEKQATKDVVKRLEDDLEQFQNFIDGVSSFLHPKEPSEMGKSSFGEYIFFFND